MTRNVKISLAAVGAFAIVVAALLFATRPSGPESAPATQQVAAGDAKLNNAPNASVTMIEYMDFECPACAQLHPVVDQLVQQYGDRVQFVVRYFPLPMHPNGEPAALAAEAANQQGRFPDMSAKLFETQQAWAGQPGAEQTFRGYAEELGLDMAAYDAAVAAPATAEKVKADTRAGAEAGVSGTPTFFVNGEQLNPQSVQDITDALDRALGQ